MPFVLKHSKTASQMFSPRVWSFRGINSIHLRVAQQSLHIGKIVLFIQYHFCLYRLITGNRVRYCGIYIFNLLFGDVLCHFGGSVLNSFGREWHVTDFTLVFKVRE